MSASSLNRNTSPKLGVGASGAALTWVPAGRAARSWPSRRGPCAVEAEHARTCTSRRPRARDAAAQSHRHPRRSRFEEIADVEAPHRERAEAPPHLPRRRTPSPRRASRSKFGRVFDAREFLDVPCGRPSSTRCSLTAGGSSSLDVRALLPWGRNRLPRAARSPAGGGPLYLRAFLYVFSRPVLAKRNRLHVVTLLLDPNSGAPLTPSSFTDRRPTRGPGELPLPAHGLHTSPSSASRSAFRNGALHPHGSSALRVLRYFPAVLLFILARMSPFSGRDMYEAAKSTASVPCNSSSAWSLPQLAVIPRDPFCSFLRFIWDLQQVREHLPVDGRLPPAHRTLTVKRVRSRAIGALQHRGGAAVAVDSSFVGAPRVSRSLFFPLLAEGGPLMAAIVARGGISRRAPGRHRSLGPVGLLYGAGRRPPRWAVLVGALLGVASRGPPSARGALAGSWRRSSFLDAAAAVCGARAPASLPALLAALVMVWPATLGPALRPPSGGGIPLADGPASPHFPSALGKALAI